MRSTQNVALIFHSYILCLLILNLYILHRSSSDSTSFTIRSMHNVALLYMQTIIH
ncbi:hypothetical protein ZEAMMB73_Zm00001d030754 [Zea mays]|uniref:Uncharacterized protein n=1 Tax=Zea mays TaxID=4577 RepID=A0A1D6KE67_MAIZE|nr:hypothetical protein ZEAMMB73_Zm00001d030754 [Zea mays]